MDIIYRFHMSEETEFVWELDVEGPPRLHKSEHADWTRLANNQCKNSLLTRRNTSSAPPRLKSKVWPNVL